MIIAQPGETPDDFAVATRTIPDEFGEFLLLVGLGTDDTQPNRTEAVRQRLVEFRPALVHHGQIIIRLQKICLERRTYSGRDIKIKIGNPPPTVEV